MQIAVALFPRVTAPRCHRHLRGPAAPARRHGHLRRHRAGRGAHRRLVLAAAGLLDGLSATTHWANDGLRERRGARPTGQRVVEHLDQRIVTAAGEAVLAGAAEYARTKD